MTTTGELAKFLSAHMQPGFFTLDMLEELHADSELPSGNSARRALGWSIEHQNPSGRILSKNGRRGNTSARIGFTPDHGMGVAVLSNTGKPMVHSMDVGCSSDPCPEDTNLLLNMDSLKWHHTPESDGKTNAPSLKSKASGTR